jgi:hypothetical protein
MSKEEDKGNKKIRKTKEMEVKRRGELRGIKGNRKLRLLSYRQFRTLGNR